MDPKHLETAAAQAHIVARALPYLRRYAGATIVVKYGGHAMGQDALASGFGSDIALLKQVGINPVVVHGGGRRSTPCWSAWRSNPVLSTGCG